MQMTIKKWGNSLATRIPKAVAESVGLRLNQEVEVEAIDGRIIITPSQKAKYSLEELLSKCKPESMTLSQGDNAWINSPPVGKEI